MKAGLKEIKIARSIITGLFIVISIDQPFKNLSLAAAFKPSGRQTVIQILEGQ